MRQNLKKKEGGQELVDWWGFAQLANVLTLAGAGSSSQERLVLLSRNTTFDEIHVYLDMLGSLIM